MAKWYGFPNIVVLMKLHSRLVVVLFLSLMSVATPTLSDRSVENGPYSFSGDIYQNPPVYRTAYSGYGRFENFGAAGSAYLPGEVAEWSHDSYREDTYRMPGRDPYSGGYPGGEYLSYSASDEEPAYGWDPIAQRGVPDSFGYGYSGQDLPPGEAVPRADRRYRFRGDGPAGVDGGGAVPWRPGYRFRPLTGQERRRTDTRVGWRPRVQEPVGEQFYRGDPPPPRDAYGYQPDGWLRSY